MLFTIEIWKSSSVSIKHHCLDCLYVFSAAKCGSLLEVGRGDQLSFLIYLREVQEKGQAYIPEHQRNEMFCFTQNW